MQNEKESNEREMVLTRTVNAPLELVWRVWTEQKHVQQWWSPRGFTNPVCEWDAKPGNKILIHMRMFDGATHPMDGEFLEVIKPEKLVFMSAALDNEGKRLFEIHNTVIFTPDGNKTKLTMYAKVSRIRPEAMVHINGMNAGWNSSIDKLEDYLQTL